MKTRVNYTIEGELLARLENYILKTFEATGSKVSRSSIVEKALVKHLSYLEIELYNLKEKRDLSVIQ